MNLQRCDVCNTQFKWGTIYKSLMLGYKPLQCSKCSTKLKITFSSRLIVAFLTVTPIGLLGNFMTYFLPLPISFIITSMIILAICMSFLDPFLVKYSSEY